MAITAKSDVKRSEFIALTKDSGSITSAQKPTVMSTNVPHCASVIAAAGPAPCWDPSHGHALGGGSHWTSGYNRMLNLSRSLIGANKVIFHSFYLFIYLFIHLLLISVAH